MSRSTLAFNRLLAWLIDWLCILGWVAVTAAVGVPLYLTGVIHIANQVVLNVVAALVMIVPVTVGTALLESGPNAASVGKRARGLAVVTAGTGSPLPFSRSLVRAGLKIMLPWLLGHAAVYGIVGAGGGSPPTWVWVVTVGAYVLPAVWIASLFVGSGRTPYDVAARTVVGQRRFARSARLIPTRDGR